MDDRASDSRAATEKAPAIIGQQILATEMMPLGGSHKARGLVQNLAHAARLWEPPASYTTLYLPQNTAESWLWLGGRRWLSLEHKARKLKARQHLNKLCFHLFSGNRICEQGRSVHLTECEPRLPPHSSAITMGVKKSATPRAATLRPDCELDTSCLFHLNGRSSSPRAFLFLLRKA
jgi:hypothetical protein